MEDLIDIPRLRMDEDYRQEMRWRMQTDLWWLTRYVLGYRKVTERHREVADTFVHKDPRKSFESQSPDKRIRLILLSRKVYKTTFNITDSIQWVIGFPEIAIMVITASNSPDAPLADAFVAECVSHFYCAQERCNHPLHIAFPEHVYRGTTKAGEFITPARKKFRRDPTIKAVSIEQSISGV